MAFDIEQKVWAKCSGNHGYHHATIIMENDNSELFLLRWRNQCWDDSIICARNMRPFIASQGFAVTMRGDRYHNTGMAGGVSH
eukprot:12058616-Ditylum_brightwellii.AAC.1